MPHIVTPTSTGCSSLTNSTPTAGAIGEQASSRRAGWWICRLAWLCIGATLWPVPVRAQVDILTNRYDPQRTGANLAETILTAENVNVSRFGKLYSYPVDGAVYAQPLYVAGVMIDGIARNVLYVATMNDKLYAFDADLPPAPPLWMRDFTSPPSVTAVPITDLVAPNLNIIGNVGIHSTPVIDRATGTIYLVARTKENGAYKQRLHALDIATGLSRSGSPTTIEGSVAGIAPESTPGPTGRIVTFDPRMQGQRTGLALANGVVLIAWGSHEDAAPYHGWVMGFDATTLGRVGIFCVSPDTSAGGIWQGGRAPAIDAAGNAYYATGNGPWDGIRSFGDSLLKFSVSRSGMAVVDFFTPSNQAALHIDDDDLSGSGFTVLPGSNLLLGGGKDGVMYLLDAGHLGHLVPNDTQVVQKLPVQGGHVMGGPVFWDSSAAGPLVYNWAEDDVLRSFRVSSGRLLTPAYAQGGVVSPGHPGGSLTVSANGGAQGTGIIWASMPSTQDGVHGPVAGILRAYDAETLRELWTSEQNAFRDRIGTLMKFVPPVVVNGRVYMPNHDGAVAVFGILPAPPSDFSVAVTPATQAIAPGQTGTFTATVGAQGGFGESVTLSAAGQPPGATVSFVPTSITGAGISTVSVSLPPDVPEGAFAITVAGTSGTSVRSAPPVRISTRPVRAIGISFVGSAVPMGTGESAGVISQANWNNAAGAARASEMGLVDASGGPTTATVTWSSSGVWMSPIADQPGNRRLMKGYLDTTNTARTTVTLAGLPQQTYDVYVYADGDNRTYNRSAAYTISGLGISTATVNLTDASGTNFGTTFTRAGDSTGNYVKFTVTASGFTLSATPTLPTGATRRAPVNGIQVVPVAPAVPDFTIAAAPGARTIAVGGSTTYSLAIDPVNGFTGPVMLTLGNVPTGLATSLSASIVSAPATVTLTVDSTPATPAATSALTITASSGNLIHQTVVTLSVNPPGPTGGAIGVRFSGSSTALMGASESAGVVPITHWNNAAGAVRAAPLALMNEAGVPTDARVTWAANGVWMTPVADQPGNTRLMKGCLDTSSTSATTVTVVGLPPGAYDVYVYTDGDNREFTRTGVYRLAASDGSATTLRATDLARVNFSGSFTRAADSAGNYMKFSIVGGGFTLTASPGSGTNATLRAPVNAIEIVPQ
jgi:hypothetical protein